MEPVNTVTPVQETETTQSQRFVFEVKTENDKFIFSCPANATFQEAFNATIQLMLNVYDMSKASMAKETEVKNGN